MSEDGKVARQAEMLVGRLTKNARHVGRWARKHGVTCYRLYDRDIPEIPLTIDRYEEHLHVAEWARGDRPSDPGWLEAMASAAAATLAVGRDRVHCKRRERQKGKAQYEPLRAGGERFAVGEGGLRFLVNLDDYLDTGLFLDHRWTRERVRSEAAGRRVLNLFCYTGAFTVHAAAGGARATVSVDLSATYLEWAADNLALNGLAGPAHRLERADVLAWLDEPPREVFDLIVLDPPSFSNSKRMTGVLDLARDHVRLIDRCLARLAPGGALYFSTNHRTLALDAEALAARGVLVEDLTRASIPLDFRDGKIHRLWRLRRTAG